MQNCCQVSKVLQDATACMCLLVAAGAGRWHQMQQTSVLQCSLERHLVLRGGNDTYRPIRQQGCRQTRKMTHGLSGTEDADRYGVDGGTQSPQKGCQQPRRSRAGGCEQTPHAHQMAACLHPCHTDSQPVCISNKVGPDPCVHG